MKNQTFISFMALLLLASVSFIGCGSDGGGGSSQDTQALTENDIAGDPSVRADPEKHLIVYFLEHPDSDKPENDTGEIGNDVIPFKYKSTLEHTFRWEDDDPDAEHFMVLEDSDGNEIFRLDVNGESITVVLEAGDYVMIIHHDGRIETTHPIFIIPSNEDDLEVNTGTDWLIKNGKVLISNILQNLHNTITHNAKAQKTTKKIVKTLLKTDACPNCNLTGAKLKNAKLKGADLTDADLTRADLSEAILTGAILTGVTLSSTMFDNATWCDGNCMCAVSSIDTCVGCASIDICTALTRCELDCDDGSLCTNDICDPITFACTHEPVDCDDGISCTVDSCDPAAGCQSAPDSTACPIPDNECLAPDCQVGVGCGTATMPDGTACTLTDGQTGECRQGECGETQAECEADCIEPAHSMVSECLVSSAVQADDDCPFSPATLPAGNVPDGCCRQALAAITIHCLEDAEAIGCTDEDNLCLVDSCNSCDGCLVEALEFFGGCAEVDQDESLITSCQLETKDKIDFCREDCT